MIMRDDGCKTNEWWRWSWDDGCEIDDSDKINDNARWRMQNW